MLRVIKWSAASDAAAVRREEHAGSPGNQAHCESGLRKAAQRVPAGCLAGGFSPGRCSINLLEIKTSVYMGKAFLKILQENTPK